MKKIISKSVVFVMTILLLNGIATSSSAKFESKGSETTVIQYSHGDPWG